MKHARTGILKRTVRVDFDPFLTPLSGMIDESCKAHLPPAWHSGVRAALPRCEVLTGARASQWQGCGSERGFYREAQRSLCGVFPTLPERSPFNRLRRTPQAALAAGNG
jgi:hypothetical protein